MGHTLAAVLQPLHPTTPAAPTSVLRIAATAVRERGRLGGREIEREVCYQLFTHVIFWQTEQTHTSTEYFLFLFLFIFIYLFTHLLVKQNKHKHLLKKFKRIHMHT